jgi:hypothetical protein
MADVLGHIFSPTIRKAGKKIKSLKKHISARKRDVSLIQRFQAGERLGAFGGRRLATLQAEKGQPIQRNLTGARIDNSTSRSNPKRVMKSR